MKKIILLNVVLLFTYVASGQNKLSIAIAGGPSFYQYRIDDESSFNREVENNVNWSAGLKLQFDVSKRVGVSSGVYYSTKGFKINFGWTYIDPNDPLIPLESEIKTGYIDIPLIVNYHFLVRKKFSLYASGGIIFSALVHKDEISTMSGGSESETHLMQDALTSLFYSLEVNTGVKYNFSKKCFLMVHPFVQWGFSSVEAEMSPHTINYGAMIGIHYAF